MKHENIGRKIRFYRQKLKLTQQDLADKIGVTWEMISRYERGNSSPMEKVPDIAKALNLNIAELVTEPETATKKGLIISAENLAPLFVTIPKDHKFKPDNTQYFHTISEWMLKKDISTFVIEPAITKIKSNRINHDGPLFISPNTEPKDSSLVLAFEQDDLLVDVVSNFSVGATFVGVVIGQEVRFV